MWFDFRHENWTTFQMTRCVGPGELGSGFPWAPSPGLLSWRDTRGLRQSLYCHIRGAQPSWYSCSCSWDSALLHTFAGCLSEPALLPPFPAFSGLGTLDSLSPVPALVPGSGFLNSSCWQFE